MKKIIYIIFIFVLTSCSKKTDLSKNRVEIGDKFGGGIVAYILTRSDVGYDANFQHGLIAATADQSKGIYWFNLEYINTGAKSGNGFINSNLIVTKQGPTATNYAAGIARAYRGGGFTDWYLPSINELSKLYFYKNDIGGFGTGAYWSSTEADDSYAWYINFYDGSQGSFFKYYSMNVRAIRAF